MGFGQTLIPHTVQTDFDGDGTYESYTDSYDPDGYLEYDEELQCVSETVTFLEGAVATAETAVAWHIGIWEELVAIDFDLAEEYWWDEVDPALETLVQEENSLWAEMQRKQWLEEVMLFTDPFI